MHSNSTEVAHNSASLFLQKFCTENMMQNHASDHGDISQMVNIQKSQHIIILSFKSLDTSHL